MNKIRIPIKLIITITLFFIACNADAQWYVGITGDFGNRVKATPSAPNGLLKDPITISTSMVLLRTIQLQKSWHLQFGIGAGTMGYTIKSAPYDSVPGPAAYTGYTSFHHYNTFYFDVSAAVGKHFQLTSTRYLAVYLSGGITYYTAPDNSGGLLKPHTADWNYLFKYEMQPTDNKMKGFVDVSVQTNLTKRFMLGLRYRHHFDPAVQGTYSYPHAKASGQLSVTQRALSIVFAVRVSGNKLGKI